MSSELAGLVPVARWRNLVRDSDVDSTARLVALVLSTYMSSTGNGAYPSKRTLADGCGLNSTRAVDQAINRLELAGLLAVHRSKGHNPNTYQALVPPPETGPREPLNHDEDPLGYLD